MLQGSHFSNLLQSSWLHFIFKVQTLTHIFLKLFMFLTTDWKVTDYFKYLPQGDYGLYMVKHTRPGTSIRGHESRMLIDKIFRLCLSHWSAAICNISVRISVCLSNLHAHHMAHYLFCPMKINSDTISMYLLPKFVNFTLILPCISSRKVQGKDRCDQNQNGHIAKMDDFTHFWSIVSTIQICIWPFSLNQAMNQPFNSTLADVICIFDI